MVQIYKCPGCGGQLVFEGGTDSMKCPHCSKVIPVSQLESQIAAGQTVGLQNAGEADNAGNGLRAYQCPACGAGLVTDEHTAATTCSYCGNPTLISERLSDAAMPSRMIPFAFDKAEAKKKFKAWAGNGLLTPGSFKKDATLNTITGVYVPYWLYSYGTNAEIFAEAERNEVSRHGNKETTKTDHFQVHRVVTAHYNDVPMNASEKMPDDSMALLEPYDYSKLTKFAMPYLSGYYAEKYNADADAFKAGIEEALKQDIINAAAESVEGYDAIHVTEGNAELFDEATEYVMLPVWSLIYQYGGKKFPIYMNGSTGKVDGQLPTSRAKALALFGAVALVILVLFILLNGGL